MTKRRISSKDPDILASAKALRRAAKRALELGLRTGTPVWVIKRGKIVDLTKEPRPRSKKRVEANMIYKGVVHGMVVELEQTAILPEGTQVDVVVHETPNEELAASGYPKGSPQAVLAALDVPPRSTAQDVEALLDAIKEGKRRRRKP